MNGSPEQTLDENVLHLSGLFKSFASTRALCGVAFTVRKGKIHALIGGTDLGSRL